MFGTERLQAVIRSAPTGAAPMAEAIESAVLDHTGGVVSDDLAVMVIQAIAG